ncbi:Protein tweety like [Heracleum sosnowskyi]|uniref:Protein tweety like n=1 Tax=Heracleum sosnowskyi TaxID=360622 RepID=A0AAD8MWT2_9APIA|nr:Protein tweety like [Heracleum sosnowskyi]
MLQHTTTVRHLIPGNKPSDQPSQDVIFQHRYIIKRLFYHHVAANRLRRFCCLANSGNSQLTLMGKEGNLSPPRFSYDCGGIRIARYCIKCYTKLVKEQEIGTLKKATCVCDSVSNNLSLLYLILFLTLFFCFCIFSTFVSSHGASHFQPTQISDGRKMSNGVDGRRIVAETNASNAPDNASLVLAAKRTHRRDPSDGFNYYNGGWDFSNSHYVYSVGFSAAPPFIAGVACCCRSRRESQIDHNQTAHTVTFSLLLLFTLATIGAGVVSYIGEEKLERSVIKVTAFVLDEADGAFGNLRNLINNLLEAKKIGVDELSLPADMQSQIDQIGGKINFYADRLHSVSKHGAEDLWNFLRPIRRTLIIVAAALVALMLVGFFIAAFGWKFLIYCLVIIGWIVVTGIFILTSMFLLIHNAVADSCVAVDEWLQNPAADSAIENIIPRVDNETSQMIYSTTRGVTYGVVQVINSAIVNVSNANIPSNAGSLYINQSGPLMPVLCNPVNSDLSDRVCAPGEVDFNNASEVWGKFVCRVSGSGICTTPGRLTPKGYNQLVATTNISSVLYQEGPFLMSLVDSTFLTDLFKRLMSNNCPGLREYSKMTYAGLLAASILLLFSVVGWIVHGEYAKKRRMAS